MQIRDHRQEYLPKMLAELKRRGQFHQAVSEAQKLVGEPSYRLEVKERLPHNRAWDVAWQLAFFRNEQDRPQHPNRLWGALRAWPRVRLSVKKGEHLPKMSAEPKRRGQFHQAVSKAQELVGETLYRLEVKERFCLWASLRAWLRVRLSVEKREDLPKMSAELKRLGQFH